MEMCLVVPFKYCLSYHVTNVPSYVRRNCMRVLVEAASQKTLKFTLTYMVKQKLKFSDFPKITKPPSGCAWIPHKEILDLLV